ncbi:methyltransferase domain-containing protein [Aliarcobacter cryaerophilus]|uniref:methyltransferase domain-containing protein n=1 Tax=Aliarcobacter cryaerophilus TaxID=28198 RepID=UPI0021B282C9|nr:methyltransferase domain-containing protein [Aliarcobacter cryaerophilus]MCT7507776.1 methyltransferase domain-containing protein [Aliarcobacter cryaerophilus]
MSDNFYRAFEDKHRGSRELIKSRLEIYLPFIEKIKEIQPKPKTIDLGCGRGEWLELLSENDCEAQGIDLDEGMLQACTQRGFNVKRQDAIEALRNLDDASISVVSGFHIVEHLPFEVLQTLVQESLRVLKPGGILIMETPNPENIKIGTENFYMDPTHIKPIPSQLLAFLPEHYGFSRTKVLRLQESKELQAIENVSLAHVIHCVSPDYAVIAQKSANTEFLNAFDELFAKEYGLSLDSLMIRFENRLSGIEQRATQAEQRATQAEQRATQAEQRATQAEQRATQAEQQLALLLNSRSWKITKPFRIIGKLARWLVYGLYHWLTFSPTSRPRRIIKQLLVSLKHYINTNPKLKYKLIQILNKFPAIKNRLKKIGSNNTIDNKIEISELTERGNEVYKNLNSKFKRLNKEKF